MSNRPLRIVIPGGSGQVGLLLARHFHALGHQVSVLSRGPSAEPWQTVHWDGRSIGPWVEELEGADVCINLAGRSINCRYTPAHRKAIHDSRVETTELLGSVIASLGAPPRLWLNASSATIYRSSVDRDMDELTGTIGSEDANAPDSWKFTMKVTNDWEAAFFRAPTPQTRKVALRTSIVFGAVQGTAFGVLLNLVRLTLGGTQGSGRQFISWIHELDFARAVEFLIDHEEIDGPINMTAPHPLPNRDFMRALRLAWGNGHEINGIPAPSILIELGAFLIRTESELVLKSRRVVPTRLLNAGFEFEFPEWPEAAFDLVHQWRNKDF